MGAAIRTVAVGIERQLENMIKRANLIPAYLNRVVYNEYRNAQRTRWMNENEGEDFTGGRWAALSPAYLNWKREKYGRTETLIRTGKLFGNVAERPNKVVTERSIRIFTTVPYAAPVDKERTFTAFSPLFYRRIMKDMRKYLMDGYAKVGI